MGAAKEEFEQWVDSLSTPFFQSMYEKNERLTRLEWSRHGYLVCQQDKTWTDKHWREHKLKEMDRSYLRNVLAFARRWEHTRVHFPGSVLERKILEILVDT